MATKKAELEDGYEMCEGDQTHRRKEQLKKKTDSHVICTF